MASITKLGDNKFRIRVYLDRQLSGFNEKQKFVTKTISFDKKLSVNKAERLAELEAEKFEKAEKSKYEKSGNMLFKDYLGIYFKNINIKQKTLLTYKSYCPRILRAIGDIKISEITPKILNEFLRNLTEYGIRGDSKYKIKVDFNNFLKEHNVTKTEIYKKQGLCEATLTSVAKGNSINLSTMIKICDYLKVEPETIFEVVDRNNSFLSRKTIKNYHSFLSGVLENAFYDEIIDENPAHRVSLKRIKMDNNSEKPEIEVYSIDECKKLFELSRNEGENFYCIILLAVLCGLRRGEILGLSWDDIDFETKSILINKNLLYYPKKGVKLTTPKTKSSIRKIVAPDIIFEQLKVVKKIQDENKDLFEVDYNSYNLCFTNFEGRPMNPDTFSTQYSRMLRKNKDKIRYVKFHGLRHTNASLLIAAKTDITTTSKRLGHKSTKTTLDIYSHLLEKTDKIASDNITKMFE